MMITQEQIDILKPGREMDNVVAQEVMGWRWYDGRGTAGPSYWEDAQGEFAHNSEFEPSTDIASAWEVVEKLKMTVTPKVDATQTSKWLADVELKSRQSLWLGFGDTAPFAICRAALRTVQHG